MNQILKAEYAGQMFGVPGRFMNVIGEPGAAVVRNQTFITESRPAPSYGERCTIHAEVRFDDECRNGHNTFAITGTVRDSRYRGDRGMVAGGCLHEEIAQAFPELAPLIRWHLTSSDGPMHYIANTVYHAGDRDHNGKRKGEPWAFETMVQFGDNPIKHKLSGKFAKWLESCAAHPGRDRFDFEVLPFDHNDRKTFGTKYTFGGFANRWHECPFDTESQALDFLCALQTCSPRFLTVPTLFSDGKARDLDAAREAAVWPDATDAELSVDPAELKAALVARHAGLMRDFRDAMLAAGFIWSDASEPATAI